ncbi:hypothetical protein EG829_05235 [bacterium]|nr:hypothetical protein [bacterium]
MKTVTILIVALGFCFQSVCFSADLTQSVKTPDGFTVHLPADWKPIPRHVLDAYAAAMAKLAPKAEKQTFNYGFQLAAARKWFDYPYILVQVNRTGRVPEEQLASLGRIEQAMDKGMEKTRESLSTIVENARLGKTSYEPSAHILWTGIALEVKGFGKVRGLIGSLLTENGFIQISCHARDQDFAGYLPVFEAIVRKTELDPELAYQSRGEASDQTDAGAGWTGTLAAVALIVGLSALVYGFRRRKKNPDA